MSISQLSKLNGIRKAETIYPGQTLFVGHGT